MRDRGPLASLTFAALLRWWRDRLAPADAGVTTHGNRRAPGLRREELAQLAGLSVDYVLRLEQGRAINPSPQVVSALAQALQLSRTERDLLYRSAGLLPPQDGTIGTHVPASVQRLVVRLGDAPIGVFAADWTILWCNDLWKALHGDPAALPLAERNVARAVFGTGPAHEALHPSRSRDGQDAFATALVADLKRALDRYREDPRLRALVTGLASESPEFRRLWDEAVPAEHRSHHKAIAHPAVGEIELDCDVLEVPGADLRLVAYTAAADSPDAGKLELLRVTGGRPLPIGR